MAKVVLTNVRLFGSGADLTTRTNKVEIMTERETKEVTSYGSNGYVEVLGGLGSGQLTAEGYFEAADNSYPDNFSWASRGSVVPMSVAPVGVTVGSKAYLSDFLITKHDIIKGSVGDVAGFMLDAATNSPVTKGFVMQAPGSAITSSSNGTGVEAGAVATGQSLYANLHVTSISGTSTPTLTVVIQSDDNPSFTSPTTRLSFTAATAIGGQHLSVVGPITDTYYRAVYTVSGSTPSFLAFITLGIG